MKKLSYDIGYYTKKDVDKLFELFNGNKGREGIVLSVDLNVPDWNNLLVTIESEKYESALKMLDMFTSIILAELL